MDDAFIDAKASMSAYKSEYKNLESQATSTLAKIRKAEIQLSEVNNTTFDNLLKGQPGYIGDQDGSFEGRIRKLNGMNSQSEEYRTTLKGIQDDWQKISLRIQQALKSEEDLQKEAEQKHGQVRSKQAAYNTIQNRLSSTEFTRKNSVALNGVLQDSEASGTYLKTLSMYLRASKTDAENAGIATDGMASSVSELRSELKQLAGVDIMKDDNTFKSTYQIMKELSEVWKDLSDTTQANITELIAGKRGGQSTSALLNNFSVAEDAMKQALNSSGSAMRENQTYMDSLQAKLNQLDSAFQKFSTDLMKSDIPKFFVDLATVFVDGADNAVKFAGALPTLTAAISGVLSVMQMSGKLKNGAGKVNMPSYICCV